MSRPLSRLVPRSWRGDPDRFWAVFRPIVKPITLETLEPPKAKPKALLH